MKTVDTEICTDVCTVETCGFSSAKTPRPDSSARFPLVDFAIAELSFNSNDYKFFPDLQMYPAVAGAVVPVYNIPIFQMRGIKAPVTLSRSTLTEIFLGKISYWNDDRILNDNTDASVRSALASVNEPIKVVVRHDSSGISMIMTNALASFDPASGVYPDYSFANTVALTSNLAKPQWCDPKTDELQVISVLSCPSPSATVVSLLVINELRRISFACNATADAVRLAFQTQNITVSVSKHQVAEDWTSWNYYVGYSDIRLVTTNVHEPVLETSLATVAISTLQEGGYWNTHFNISDYVITHEVQSIFLLNSTNSNAFTFNITFQTPRGFITTKSIDSSSANLSTLILEAIDDLYLGLANVTLIPASVGLEWIEYQISLSPSYTSHYYIQPRSSTVPILKVRAAFISTGESAMSSVFVTRLQAANNFPKFQDTSYKGVASGGKYTCHKRSLSYQPFSYYTAALTDLNAVVIDIYH